MNESKNNQSVEQQPLMYQNYMNPAYADDEINLVDVWIALIAYKKQFIVYFSLLLMTSILFLLSFHQEEYELTSLFQIGTIELQEGVRQIESIESTKSKLSNVLIPSFTQKWMKDKSLENEFKTSISSDKGSDVILVKNNVSQADVTLFSDYQIELLAQLLKDHKLKISLTQNELRQQLKAEMLRLKQMEHPLTLELKLKSKVIDIQESEERVESLINNYKSIKKGGHDGLLATLSSDELSEVMTKGGRIIDQLLSVRYEKFLLDNLSGQQTLKNSIAQEKLSLQNIEKTHFEVLETQQLKITNIKLKIDNVNYSRVLQKPMVSFRPSGLSKKAFFIILVFASGFIAFIIVLLAMFKDKVNLRLLETKGDI